MRTLNDYDFDVRADVPEKPDKLFVPAQLEAAILAAYNLDSVEVSERFRTRVTDVTQQRAGGPLEARVSWQVFDDEEHRFEDGDGWAVICSALESTEKVERRD